MKLSPLKLEGSYFTDISIHSQASAKNEDIDRVELNVEHDAVPDQTKPRVWYASVKVKISSPSGVVTPYIGEVTMLGGFSVVESWPEDKLERLIRVNGCGILYAAIREMVCNLTSRGFFDMLVLPSLSFAQMFAEVEQKRKEEAEKQAQLKLEPQKQPATSLESAAEASKES